MTKQKMIATLSLLLLAGSPAHSQIGGAGFDPGLHIAQAPAPAADAAPAATAPDETDAEVGPAQNFIGSATVGYRYTKQDTEGYKFDEFRDMKSGVLLGTEGMYFRPDGYYGYFAADALAQKDRSAEYRGGHWGGIQYSIYGNTIRHKYTNKGTTFFTSGVGSDNVTYNPAVYGISEPGSLPANAAAWNFTVPTNPDLWKQVTYEKTQDVIGGKFVYKSVEHPWYANLRADYRKIKGMAPLGAASALTPSYTGATANNKFGHAVELPAPLDGSNLTSGAEAGYTNKDYTIALTAEISQFKSDFDYLTFRDPYITFITGGAGNNTATQTVSLAPDSKSTTIGVKAIAKQLPLDSHLALNASKQMNRSDIALRNTIANSTTGGTYTTTTLGLSEDSFAGKIDYDNASLIWTAHPTDKLSTNVAARYRKMHNSSEEVTFTNGAESLSTEYLSYTKSDIAVGAGYKLPVHTDVDLTLSRLVINREGREEAPKNEDRKAHLVIRNNALDKLAGSLHLETMTRRLDFGAEDSGEGVGTDAQKAAYALRFFRSVDVAPKTRNAAKVSLEYLPIDNLALTGEYGYAKDSYKETVLGVKEDKRDEIYFDVSYEKPAWFKVMAFYDVEKSRNNGQWRQMAAPSNGNAYDPAPDNNNWNWTGEFSANDYYYGASVAIPVVEDKVDVTVGFTRMKNDGKAEFTSARNLAAIQNNIQPVNNYNDFTRDDLAATVSYKPMPRLVTSLTYAQQKLTVDDFAWEKFVPVIPNNNNRILSNAGSDLNYDVKLIYAAASYEF